MSTKSPGALDAPPEALGRSIERGRLAARLGGALRSGSVMLTAGAGFGKTTSLEQGLKEAGLPFSWVGCSEAERAPGTLLVRIVDGISTAVPGAADVFAEGLAAGLEQLDAIAATGELIAELSKLLVEPVVVVIDDAEHLDGAEQSQRLLATLLRAEVPLLHLAIASRRSLDLRVAKPRAAGRLTELGAADLAFDAAECAELIQARAGLEPSPEQVDAMMRATEGWPLGIALAAGLVGREGDNADALRELASAPDLQRYLSEELVESLPSDLHSKVIDSSVARSISPDIERALGLPEDFRDQVQRAGLLIRVLDDGETFVYHPLLREFLLERLRADRDDEERRRLHAAVAPAVASAGDAIASTEHWLEAERWAEAVEAIETQGLALLTTTPEQVRRWLSLLPREERARPTMRGIEGQLEWGAGDHPAAREALTDAIRGFEEQPNPPAEWLARFTLADSLFNMGDFEAAAELAEGWDGKAAEAAGILAPATAIDVGICLASIGRFEESQQLGDAANRHPDAGVLGPVEIIRLAFHDWPRGHLDRAFERAISVLEDLESPGKPTAPGEPAEDPDPFNRHLYVLATLAIMHDDRGDLDKALEMWFRVREGASAGGAPFLADASQAICAQLLAQTGQLSAAEAQIAPFKSLEKGWREYVGHAARAAIASGRGNAAEAESHAEKTLESAKDAPILFRFWAGVDLIWMLAEVGRLERAAEILDGTMARIDEVLPGEVGRWPRSRLIVLRSWLAHLDGDLERADADLQLYWEEAGESLRFGIRREWPRIEPVLWGALERGALGPDAIEDVARALPEGLQLVPFMKHPDPGVRRAALAPALSSGSPDALAALSQLADDPEEEVASAAKAATQQAALALPPLRFEVLGSFSVRRGAWSAGDGGWRRPIDARLVRYLLANLDRPVPEDLIFEALWPGKAASSARRSLQVAVSGARHVLDPPGSEESAIQAADRSYQLVLRSRDVVDAEEFRFAAEAALKEEGNERRALLERARSLWGGEPLPEDRYDDWATAYRERLSDHYISVLTALIQLQDRAGGHGEAADLARELVDLDPLNEEGHRALMTAYARGGRRGYALRQYLECRRALVDGLGVEPAAVTTQLQARILAGETV